MMTSWHIYIHLFTIHATALSEFASQIYFLWIDKEKKGAPPRSRIWVTAQDGCCCTRLGRQASSVVPQARPAGLFLFFARNLSLPSYTPVEEIVLRGNGTTLIEEHRRQFSRTVELMTVHCLWLFMAVYGVRLLAAPE